MVLEKQTEELCAVIVPVRAGRTGMHMVIGIKRYWQICMGEWRPIESIISPEYEDQNKESLERVKALQEGIQLCEMTRKQEV
jgi:hypothetical protein